LQRLQRDWARLADDAAPNKRLTLSQDAVNSIGGVVVVSADQNIRFDNTFEGRIERLADSLQGFIADRLTPQSGEVANG
jgi:V/A-type H+-transporting ATPase subunit E